MFGAAQHIDQIHPVFLAPDEHAVLVLPHRKAGLGSVRIVVGAFVVFLHHAATKVVMMMATGCVGALFHSSSLGGVTNGELPQEAQRGESRAEKPAREAMEGKAHEPKAKARHGKLL
jgi:hypothetical protein